MKENKMKNIFWLLFLLAVTGLFCNEVPVVSNVIVQQRDDGTYLVDIWYDVEDADGDLMLVEVYASNDQSVSWDFMIASIEGDFGTDISSGNGKHIIWDFASDHPQHLNIPTMIKITADDRNGNIGEIEWCNIPPGVYTFGQYNETYTIMYNYEIMKNEVTNEQYKAYLEEALAAGDIWVEEAGDNDYVMGHYEGDANFEEGDYIYYLLGTIVEANYGRIYYNGSSFVISSPYGYNPGDFDQHPVINVSWFGAKAFAEHYGWRLPNEFEWEKAARGNTGNGYGCGSGINYQKVNCNNSQDPWDNGTTPVGFYNGQNYSGFETINSPSPFGCYDMSGNVAEWTNTVYQTQNVVVRGGSWSSHVMAIELCAWNAEHIAPNQNSIHRGFRCARTVNSRGGR